jgi:hypothetical protein
MNTENKMDTENLIQKNNLGDPPPEDDQHLG